MDFPAALDLYSLYSPSQTTHAAMSKGIYSDTPVDEIPALHRQAYATFLSGKTRSIEYRKRQIKQLGFLIQDNEQEFCRALEQDFGRPAFETITGELNPAKQEIEEVYHHLDQWAKPVRVKTSFAWKGVKPTVYQEPKGAVHVRPLSIKFSPTDSLFLPAQASSSSSAPGTVRFSSRETQMAYTWTNTRPRVHHADPVTLLLIPLLGAIAAGCTALVKVRLPPASHPMS